MSSGHLYAVPDEDVAARVRSAYPGAKTLVVGAGNEIAALRAAAVPLSPLIVGWLPDGPLGKLPASGQVVREGAGWVVRFRDFAQVESLPAVAGNPERIIVRRACSGLGDLITVLTACQGYRDQHPAAEIHLRSIDPIADIARGHPAIAQVHTSDDTLPANAMTYQLGLPCPAAAAESALARPAEDRATLFARAMGVAPGRAQLALTDEELAEAADWIQTQQADGNFLALVWRTNEAYKDYPHMRALRTKLAKHHAVCVVEHEKAVPGWSTRGLSIRQTAAVISHAQLVVTGDTGWLHVAGALERPVFGLYGSQNPIARQGPYAVPGGWMAGSCPLGRQPCCEQTCLPLGQTPPCMRFSAAAAASRISETLALLP